MTDAERIAAYEKLIAELAWALRLRVLGHPDSLPTEDDPSQDTNALIDLILRAEAVGPTEPGLTAHD